MCSPGKEGPPAMRTPSRDPQQRRTDTLALLATPALDGWVATASPDGAPYVVPLSLAWVQEQVVLAMPAGSRTARNLATTSAARLGVGPTRDVVMIDATVERIISVADPQAADTVGAAYAAQADWDPRGQEDQVYVVLNPVRIQAWREADEIDGRTLMRDGVWLV